jgi:hypothetical protein
VIDQDTKGVPGLCDIPATILQKIESCDALVADLSYVATSEGKRPRSCSNPNVLFEVGFAFHAVGPERMILVMNNAYGPTTDQIFDLDHRRHPIAFRYPEGNRTRREIVARLANDLEQAIRPIVALGTRDRATPEDVAATQRDVDMLRQELSVLTIEDESRYWTGALSLMGRPPERWRSLREIEGVLAARRGRDERGHEFPPQTKGNERREWGIFNGTYRSSWILSRSGAFLYKSPMTFNQRYPLDRPDGGIQPHTWLNIEIVKKDVFHFLEFSASISHEFRAHEEVQIVLSFPVRGLKLVMGGTVLDRYVEHIEECRAADYEFSRRFAVSELQSKWRDICGEVIDGLVELFPEPLGRPYPTFGEWAKTYMLPEP